MVGAPIVQLRTGDVARRLGSEDNASALRNSGCFNCFSRPRGRVEIRHSLCCRHEDESSETGACQAPALFSMLKSFVYNAPGSLLL